MTDRPFALLDRSGRSLHWILIANKNSHIMRREYDKEDCHIVLCPREDKNSPQDITSRPCHKEQAFFRLKDNVHEWLEEMNFPYQLEYRWVGVVLGWHVGFLDDDQAMLFKLAWSDQ